ncbi:MAG: hypothetical protein A2V77_13155 [Anaeromyxobacter sp. RBG_16_69_14]|nr:MAG: hypothetical protein A2V77_13155 [Anaeromyxobacter sp. RBG_16_69_14]
MGYVLLTEHESNDTYKGSSQLSWNSHFIDVDDAYSDDPERRTWRQLLGEFSPKSPWRSTATAPRTPSL